MRVKNMIMAIAGCAFLASCSTVRMTSSSAEVDANVSAYPTIADLKVGPQRVSKTVRWRWNPFNTTSLKMRRGNAKAELIKEAGADILVEPEYVQRTSWCNLLGGYITVSGYPATLDNFRNATPEDIEAIRAMGLMKGGQYVLLTQDDISGVVIGQASVPSSTQTPYERVTSSIETAQQEIPETAQQEIPGDPVSVAQQTPKPTTANSPKSSTTPTSSAASLASGSDTIAYDRIGKERFLTTMAREYYGNPDFWSYIYEANSHRFGHPDRIKPGTSVIIPNLDRYGVDPKNPADVEKAKALAREIYARYGKWI